MNRSVRGLMGRYRGPVGLTLALVLGEAAIDLLFPLFIGLSINGLLVGRYTGLMALGGLSLAALVVGSGRRFYDSRVYARIYRETALEMVDEALDSERDVSTVSAHANLLTELVNFLEDSLPSVVRALLNVGGGLLVLAPINLGVTLACLSVLALVLVVYLATGQMNLRLNAGYNDELERQVAALGSRARPRIEGHFAALMRWNVRLSDLETVNYTLIWLGIIALLVYAPVALVDGQTEYGFVFAALIYVFQYIEGLLGLPLYLQQLIRLREISGRLSAA